MTLEDPRGVETVEADVVVLALPAHVACGVTADLDDKVAGTLAQIPYVPVTLVHLGYPASAFLRPLGILPEAGTCVFCGCWAGFFHRNSSRTELRLVSTCFRCALAAPVIPRRSPCQTIKCSRLPMESSVVCWA